MAGQYSRVPSNSTVFSSVSSLLCSYLIILIDLSDTAGTSLLVHVWLDNTLEQWFLTCVRPNPRGSVSQSQGFGRSPLKHIKNLCFLFSFLLKYCKIGPHTNSIRLCRHDEMDVNFKQSVKKGKKYIPKYCNCCNKLY